ncbi:MAG: hypothetical protein WCI47_01355 [bacterium]
MATKPPVKSKSSNTSKSNIAKSSGLNKAVVFNKKLVAIIAVILIVAVGYLYVRLSHASSAAFTWSPNGASTASTGPFNVTRFGQVTTKEGRPALATVDGHYTSNVKPSSPPGMLADVRIYSYVNWNTSYCVTGYNYSLSEATAQISIPASSIVSNTFPQNSAKVDAGQHFTICIDAPATLKPNSSLGHREIWASLMGNAPQPGNIGYIYDIQRMDYTQAPPPPGPKK